MNHRQHGFCAQASHICRARDLICHFFSVSVGPETSVTFLAIFKCKNSVFVSVYISLHKIALHSFHAILILNFCVHGGCNLSRC